MMKIANTFLCLLAYYWAASTRASKAQGLTRRVVVGGEPAGDQEFPFFVQSLDASCGGVLIANDLVLTTSTCAASFIDKVLVGSHGINGGSDQSQGEWRKIKSSMAVHPNADLSGSRDGFAIFKIEPVTLSNIQPAALNLDQTIPVLGQGLTVAGFGVEIQEAQDDHVDYYGPEYTFPDELIKATVKVADDDVCYAMIDGTYAAIDGIYQVFDVDTMLCTLADQKLGRGPCYGDAGGPLVDDSMTLIGIVSGINFCSDPWNPTVYHRVSGASGWIHETMCKLTGDRSALPFDCPDFLCPVDQILFGYPTVSLPDHTNQAIGWNGFTPSDITQSPTAGTDIPFNSSTLVTMTATDGSGNTASCEYTVKVPPLQSVGEADLYIESNTTYSPLLPVYFFYPTIEVGGPNITVYRIEAWLTTFYYGPSNGVTKITGTLKYNGTSYGPSLTVTADEGVNGTDLSTPFTVNMTEDLSGWEIDVSAVGAADETYVSFYLYGQVEA